MELDEILENINANDEQKEQIRKAVESGQINIEQLEEQVKGSSGQCPYCLIAEGKIEAKVVKETLNFIACLEIRPANIGHTIVFPRKHIEDISSLSKEEVLELFVLVQEIGASLRKMFPGVNIIISNGKEAGQMISHLVVHVIPRTAKDGVGIAWRGKEVNADDLDNALVKIKSGLTKVKKKEVKTKSSSKGKLPRAESREV